MAQSSGHADELSAAKNNTGAEGGGKLAADCMASAQRGATLECTFSQEGLAGEPATANLSRLRRASRGKLDEVRLVRLSVTDSQCN